MMKTMPSTIEKMVTTLMNFEISYCIVRYEAKQVRITIVRRVSAGPDFEANPAILPMTVLSRVRITTPTPSPS